MGSKLLRKVVVAIMPRHWMLKTRLSNGAIVSGYNRSGWGGRGVYIFGDALEPHLAALEEFVRPGDVFVDIGASVGAFSMKAAKRVGETGCVVSVEPFARTAWHLMRNVELNGFRNCRVRNLCVGKTTGETKFYMNEDKPNSFGLTQHPGAGSLSVLCASLDDLCAWERLERLDYLKVDAEGAEKEILEGGAKAIERFRPIIQVEISIDEVKTPEGYLRFAVPKEQENREVLAGNSLFLPVERTEAVSRARQLGWIEQ